jgi:hypothetical protein
MQNSYHVDAENMLGTILKNQPQLLETVKVSGKGDGAALADFCADFIQRYSEHLKKMDSA